MAALVSLFHKIVGAVNQNFAREAARFGVCETSPPTVSVVGGGETLPLSRLPTAKFFCFPKFQDSFRASEFLPQRKLICVKPVSLWMFYGSTVGCTKTTVLGVAFKQAEFATVVHRTKSSVW